MRGSRCEYRTPSQSRCCFYADPSSAVAPDSIRSRWVSRWSRSAARWWGSRSRSADSCHSLHTRAGATSTLKALPAGDVLTTINTHGRPPMLNRTRCFMLALLASTALAAPAEARITRLEISTVEPAFGGQAFGGTGAYERLIGKAHGEVDPRDTKNAIIQDIALAPRNARGMVEYTTDVEILRPADRQKGNGILFFNVVNR